MKTNENFESLTISEVSDFIETYGDHDIFVKMQKSLDNKKIFVTYLSNTHGLSRDEINMLKLKASFANPNCFFPGVVRTATLTENELYFTNFKDIPVSNKLKDNYKKFMVNTFNNECKKAIENN